MTLWTIIPTSGLPSYWRLSSYTDATITLYFSWKLPIPGSELMAKQGSRWQQLVDVLQLGTKDESKLIVQLQVYTIPV